MHRRRGFPYFFRRLSIYKAEVFEFFGVSSGELKLLGHVATESAAIKGNVTYFKLVSDLPRAAIICFCLAKSFMTLSV